MSSHPPDPRTSHLQSEPSDGAQPHSHGAGHFEIEVKLRPASIGDVIQRAHELGFQIQQPRGLERNVLLDTSNNTLRNRGEILRLREFAGDSVLTYKGASVEGGKHKQREELEVSVSSAVVAGEVFARLGFAGTFRYEKYRTIYKRREDNGLLIVDETPIGPFLELEGTPEWIDRVATELGFAEADYITDSYGQIWVQHCTEHGIPLCDFVFPSNDV